MKNIIPLLFSLFIIPQTYAEIGDQVLSPRNLNLFFERHRSFTQGIGDFFTGNPPAQTQHQTQHSNPQGEIIDENGNVYTFADDITPRKTPEVYKPQYTPPTPQTIQPGTSPYNYNNNEPSTSYDVVLEFSKSESIPLGSITFSPYNKAGLKIQLEKYLEISKIHAHEVALLNLIDHQKKVETVGKVLIGGEQDYACKNPIIITDLHGTLDKRDRCTAVSVDRLIEKYNATFIIVSSAGAYASHGLSSLGFKNTHQILVLDQGNSGDFYNGGKVTEKSMRIMKNLWSSGSCILGFTSESPHEEGRSASYMGIAYFAVNQEDKKNTRTEWRTETYCENNQPQEKPLLSDAGCTADYQEEIRSEIECAIETPGTFSVFGNNVDKKWVKVNTLPTQSTQPPQPSSQQFQMNEVCVQSTRPSFSSQKRHNSQYSEQRYSDRNFNEYTRRNNSYYDDEYSNEVKIISAKWTGQIRQNNSCKRITPEIIPATLSQANKNQWTCKSGYNLREKQVPHEVLINSTPSVDIREFPEGSIYSRDWCELADQIEKKFQKK